MPDIGPPNIWMVIHDFQEDAERDHAAADAVLVALARYLLACVDLGQGAAGRATAFLEQYEAMGR